MSIAPKKGIFSDGFKKKYPPAAPGRPNPFSKKVKTPKPSPPSLWSPPRFAVAQVPPIAQQPAPVPVPALPVELATAIVGKPPKKPRLGPKNSVARTRPLLGGV